MKEEFEKLKKKGYTNEKFEAYIRNPNVKKIYNAAMLNELKAVWYAEEIMVSEEEVLKELKDDHITEHMNKDELDQWAVDMYGIDLDKRYSKENMLLELKEKLKKQNEE